MVELEPVRTGSGQKVPAPAPQHCLQERRTEINMVQTYKIVTGVDMVNSELWFERADSRRTTINNTARHNLVPERSHYEYRRNFLTREW